jgi:hypothetical protein
MKCTYHPATETQVLCSTCNKPLCAECSHQIKGNVFCQECLVQGAEWASSMKGLKLPTDSPKRAALISLIPGMGAVYNGDYVKAITFFAVFAALTMMADRVADIFGFAAFSFLVFTMFDSYRAAEAANRARVMGGGAPLEPTSGKDRTVAGWGIFLIVLGVIFLLQNLIPFRFLERLWPLVFIGIGAYLVYYYLTANKSTDQPVAGRPGSGLYGDSKEF